MPILAGALAVAVLLVVVFCAALTAALGLGSGTCGPDPAVSPDPKSAADIPLRYLALYQQAGARYGLPWPVLAAIGKVESDHGRSPEPGIHSGANPAGAMGPMQFLAGTWATYGVDGDNDGHKNVYDPADAIPAAANMLTHAGAPQHIDKALYAYNHAGWYVVKVLRQATRYAGGQDPSALAITAGGCSEAALPPNAVAAKVIAFARAQLGKPYLWGATGPNAYDCSGLTMKAYASAGITIPRVAADQWTHEPHVQPPAQPQPGDLVFFVTEGTRTAPGHVGLYIGNAQMIEAPNHTAPVRISTTHRPDLIGYARPSSPKPFSPHVVQ